MKIAVLFVEHMDIAWSVGNSMDDFAVLVGVLASGSIAINLYLVKSIADLCSRISHLEGKLSRK